MCNTSRGRHGAWVVLLAALLLCALPMGAAAQRKEKKEQGRGHELVGRAVDSTSRQGVAYATVQLVTPEGEVFSGAICDSEGNFKLVKVPSKALSIKVQALGYKPKTLHLDLESTKNNDFAIGNVPLTIDQLTIEQVTVKGDAPFLMLKPNRKVVTPQTEDVASGAVMTDLLKRIPDFEVTSPMDITLRGAAFRVLINGKPSGLSPTQLNTINLAEVASIEIITTPSVRYRASDVGGVVNIKLKRYQVGFNSVLQAAGGSDNCYSLSASANVGLKKVNFFGALFGGYEGAKNAFTYSSTDAQGAPLERYQLNDRMNNLRLRPKVGIDYLPTKKDVLSIFWAMDYYNDKYTRRAERTYKAQAIQHGGGLSRERMMSNEANALYTHTFNDEGLELSVSAIGTLDDAQGATERHGLELGDREWRVKDSNPNDFSFSFSADVAAPLPHAFQLDAGLAADVAGSSVGAEYSTRAASAEDWTPIEEERQRSSSLTQVYGAYGDLSWEASDKVTLNAGVRYEHYRMRSNDERQSNPYGRHANDAFFSGGVAYTPIKALHFSLSYSGRVDRPGASMLTSAKRMADFYNEFSIGNQRLMSAYSHGVEFSMAQRMESCSFYEDAKWTYIANPIESYSSKLTDSTWLKSYVNLKQERNLYVGVGGNWDAASWCSVWFNARGQGVKSQDKEGDWLVNDEWSFGVRMGADFPINSMWALTAWGGYSSASRSAYRHYKAQPALNAGVYFYPLRNRNFVLVLQGINLLTTGMNYTTHSDGVTANWDFDWQTRAVYLNVYWRFGGAYRSKTGERFNSNINAVGR